MLPAMAVGAGIGGIADVSSHETIYDAARSSRLRVSPLVSPERLGAQLSLAW